MENEARKGKQKIEMTLIASEKARAVGFSKRKNTPFQQAEKLANRVRADVGIMLFSPSRKPCSYGSTSVETIIDKYFGVKLEDCQRDYVEGKLDGWVELDDLRKELEAWKEKEKNRILMYKIMHSGSEIPTDKHMEKQKLAIKLRLEKVLEDTRSAIQAEQLDLNVDPEPEEEESS